MSDLISRKALLKYIDNNYRAYWHYPTAEQFINLITNAPAIGQGEIAELKANSERLRKAAEKLVAVMVDALPRFDIIEQGRVLDRLMKVMYDTPSQSLQAHDDEVIERCAIRGRLAQLENKVVDIEICKLKGKS